MEQQSSKAKKKCKYFYFRLSLLLYINCMMIGNAVTEKAEELMSKILSKKSYWMLFIALRSNRYTFIQATTKRSIGVQVYDVLMMPRERRKQRAKRKNPCIWVLNFVREIYLDSYSFKVMVLIDIWICDSDEARASEWKGTYVML